MFTEANLTVHVSDVHRALAFYRDVLGMKFVRGYGDHWQEVELPGLRLGLHPGGKKPLVPHAPFMEIGLRVDDLDAATKALAKHGVTFTPVNDSGSRIARFTDPDGNPLYLIELKGG